MSDPTTPATVTLVSPQGAATDVPADQAQAWIDRGFTEQTVSQRDTDIGTSVRDQQSSTAKALVEGGLRGASFGLSDVVQRAVGGEQARLDLEGDEEAHPIASFVGTLGGSLLTGNVAKGLGGAVAEGLGGGALATIAGAGAEGGLIGAGQGVSEAALSEDPLTAENIAGAISSNALLGAGFGAGLSGVGILAEKGLARASAALREASAARAALQSVPEDLANLDENGLKGALKTATAEHAADIDAEKSSLEQLRVEKRVEVANQVQDLHDQMADEFKIHNAVAGDDVGEIDGVKDIRTQLRKSWLQLRGQFDSPLSVQRDPMSLIKPLETRQTALEALQQKAPEIQATLLSKGVADTRINGLQYVDNALAQTKQQIEDIQGLAKSPTNPVSSARLTLLKSGPSVRMEAIAAAQDALKNGPELGLVAKGAKAAAFAGGTALAHMIPGVGILAPFAGKYAADAVGALAKRLTGTIGAVADKTSAALDTFLTVGKKLKIPATATATHVLSSVRFGQGPEPKSDALHDIYNARAAELRNQTYYAPDGSVQVRPEVRQQIASTFDGVRPFSPVLADQLETKAVAKIAYLSSKLIRKPDAAAGPQIGPDNWHPSDLECRSYGRIVRACEDPSSVELRLAHGICTPEEANAYQTCYPARFQALQQRIFEATPTLAKTLPMNKKVALSIFTGIPVTPLMKPPMVQLLQATFAVEPGSNNGTQAPRAQPSFGKFGSLKDIDKPTPAQERAM